jgi:hypothetical protein
MFNLIRMKRRIRPSKFAAQYTISVRGLLPSDKKNLTGFTLPSVRFDLNATLTQYEKGRYYDDGRG